MSSTWVDSAITTADRFLPRLFVSDEVRSATMSASTGTASVVQNLTTYSRWRATAAPATLTADFGGNKTIDYVALYVTDPDASDFDLEYHDGTGWHSKGATLSRTGAGCILWVFDSITADKIRITTSALPEVAVLKSGAALQVPVGLPVGYEPALFNPNEKLSNTASVTGQILGTQVESQRMDEILNFDLLDPDWINDYWMPARLLIRTVGVFFAWNLADFPEHVVYGVVTGDPKASYSQVNTMRLQLKLEGPKHVL